MAVQYLMTWTVLTDSSPLLSSLMFVSCRQTDRERETHTHTHSRLFAVQLSVTEYRNCQAVYLVFHMQHSAE